MYSIYDSTGYKVGSRQKFTTYLDALIYKHTFGNNGWYIKELRIN